MQNEELARSAKEAWRLAEDQLEREARSFEARLDRQPSRDAEKLTRDLKIASLQSEVDDLRAELLAKDQEVRRLAELAEKSSQSSVDDAVRGYIKSPYQEELQYWRDLALRSSQRGFGSARPADEAASLRFSALEEELNIRERELESREETLRQKEKESLELKYSLQAKEGQIRMKEAQIKATKADIDRAREELEAKEREFAEQLSTFTFSATCRGQMDSDTKKEIEEYERQIESLERELEQTRDQYLHCKKTETDALAKNQSLENQLLVLDYKLKEFEDRAASQLTTAQNFRSSVDNLEEPKATHKQHQLDSFLVKVNTVLEKAQQLFSHENSLPPQVAAIFNRIVASKASPHIQMSLLPSLLSHLLSSQGYSSKDWPQVPLPTPQIQPAQTQAEASPGPCQLTEKENLEPRLLAALSSTEARYRAAKRSADACKRVVDALLEGWNEDSLKQAVADTQLMFEALWKIEDNEGNNSVANKKVQAALLCLSKLASGIGQTHLSKAMKSSHQPLLLEMGDKRRQKESRDHSMMLDEHLLFLGRQVLGKDALSDLHN